MKIARMLALILILSFCLYQCDDSGAPEASVPMPEAPLPHEFPTPHQWNQVASYKGQPLDYSLDLDVLAPLGTGLGNAALWLKDFQRVNGTRRDEWKEAKNNDCIAWIFHGTQHQILPPDHPLLLEAEGWVNQTSCSFIPDIFPIRGPATAVPDLNFVLTLGKSWVARGLIQDDSEDGLQDIRKCIRLGRLLRQDGFEFIQDATGVALIRYGAQGVYDVSISGDKPIAALLATLAIHDSDSIRLLQSNQWDNIPRFYELVKQSSDRSDYAFMASDLDFNNMLKLFRTGRSRAIRLEALWGVWATTRMGNINQRSEAISLLSRALKDHDPMVAQCAEWCRNFDFAPNNYKEIWGVTTKDKDDHGE